MSKKRSNTQYVYIWDLKTKFLLKDLLYYIIICVFLAINYSFVDYKMSFFNSNKVPSSGPTFSFFSNKKESNKKVDAGENSEKIAEENNLRSSFYEQPANPTGIHGKYSQYSSLDLVYRL